MQVAKIARRGSEQIVLFPPGIRFTFATVTISRRGDEVVLRPGPSKRPLKTARPRKR